MSLTQNFFFTHKSGGRPLDLWCLGFFCLSVLQSLLCGFHPEGDFVLHNGCYSSSHHIHSPSIRKQELGQGLLFQKAFTEVPPNNFHVYVIGHSNRVRWLPLDSREEGICSLLSGSIAVLSTVEVLLLRKIIIGIKDVLLLKMKSLLVIMSRIKMKDMLVIWKYVKWKRPKTCILKI